MHSVKEAERMFSAVHDNPAAFVFCYITLATNAVADPQMRKAAKFANKKYTKEIKALLDAEIRLPFAQAKADTDDAHREASLETSWAYVKAGKPLGFIAAFVPCRAFCQGTKYANTIAYRECVQELEHILIKLGLTNTL